MCVLAPPTFRTLAHENDSSLDKPYNRDMSEHARALRIGELSRRVGASPSVLRAWERRYELFQPQRSPKGYRLYSNDDLARAAERQAQLARGIAPAQAAELAKSSGRDLVTDVAAATASDVLSRLRQALDAYDGAAGTRLVDRCLLNLGLATAIQSVLLPYLRELGTRWEKGEVSVAEEHFASSVVRRRIMAAAEGWEHGRGPVALLACAPGEEHDIGLVCLGVSLHSYHGWRVKYLGANTPLPDLIRAARVIRPELVVTSAVTPARFFPELARWRQLSGEFALAMGGAGASARLARTVGATYLSGDPVTAAARIGTNA